MLLDTQALKEESANGHADALGKRGDAGTSFQEQTHKTDEAAPLDHTDYRSPGCPKAIRVEAHGRMAFVIWTPRGYLVHTDQGVMNNPWTSLPFRRADHARNAIKAFFKYGRWPRKKVTCYA